MNEFYLWIDSGKKGPFSSEQINTKLIAGEIGRESLWCERDGNWRALKENPKFFEEKDQAPAAPPVHRAPPEPLRLEEYGPLLVEGTRLQSVSYGFMLLAVIIFAICCFVREWTIIGGAEWMLGIGLFLNLIAQLVLIRAALARGRH